MNNKQAQKINNVRGIIHDIRKELGNVFKRGFVSTIVDKWGNLGIVFVAIQEYEAHGRYVLPLTHKHYRDLVFYLNHALKENMAHIIEVDRTCYPTKAMKRYQKDKAKAQQEAIDYQTTKATKPMSYTDLAYYSDHFTKLGKRYGLLKEFKENGII